MVDTTGNFKVNVPCNVFINDSVPRVLLSGDRVRYIVSVDQLGEKEVAERSIVLVFLPS
jgi:hypothetical protein